MTEYRPYNPLDRRNLAASVAEALLERKAYPLGALPKFQGAGIYVIYYCGDFPAYAALASANADGNFRAPIYIGKADPPGGRKGGQGLDSDAENALRSRLGEHARSVRAASNLDISHFAARFLVVEEMWIPFAEGLLISKFGPVWNTLVDGFGNHPPGKGRHKGMLPRWDVLHPGRPGFTPLQPRPETGEQIATEVEAYLRTVPLRDQPKLLGNDI